MSNEKIITKMLEFVEGLYLTWEGVRSRDEEEHAWLKAELFKETLKALKDIVKEGQDE